MAICRSSRFQRAARSVWLAAIVALAAGSSQAAHAGLSEAQQRERILFEAREQEQQIAVGGFLYGEPALDAYLQAIMDRLYPDRRGDFHVHVLRNTDVNAFADVTGSVYFNAGTFLRVRNEAELASILAHEGGHLVADHVYRQRLQDKSAMGAKILLGSLGLLIAQLQVTSYSRDLESAADKIAIERLTAAGYDPKAAATVFERRAREVKERKIKEPPGFIRLLYADHPQLLDRARNTSELAANAPPGELRRDEFLAATHAVRLATLNVIHEQRDGLALIALLEDEGQTAEFAPAGEFLLGEGFRLRDLAGDEDRALAHYDQSILSHPEFAPAFAARGKLLDRRGERERAASDLAHFLELDPGAEEAAFARQSLDRLRKEQSP